MSQPNVSIRALVRSDLDQVIELYQACFAEPPWHESFDPLELRDEFTDFDYWPDATFLVASIGNRIVGGTVGFDLHRKRDVAKFIPPDPHERTYYLSELFVAKDLRKQGIAEALIQRRFSFARNRGYTKGVVRTSVNQPIIRSIYERLGFGVVATQDVESEKICDGVKTVLKDTRIILAGRLP